MRRVKPAEGLRDTPCSMVAVACAIGAEKAAGSVVLKDGYATLASMNKYIRSFLPVVRQRKYKRGERPLLKDLHHPGRAIVCVLGHYLYLEGETYYSFFRNSDDEVVCVWELK